MHARKVKKTFDVILFSCVYMHAQERRRPTAQRRHKCACGANQLPNPKAQFMHKKNQIGAVAEIGLDPKKLENAPKLDTIRGNGRATIIGGISMKLQLYLLHL